MFYLFIGLLLLWLASEILVSNGVKLAKSINISSYIIGILVISLGTSFPELVLSIYGVLTEHQSIVTGNIIGSNIANIALGLGLLFIIAKKDDVSFDFKLINTDQNFLLLSTGFILYGCYYNLFDRGVALLALLVMVIFIKQQLLNQKNHKVTEHNNSHKDYKLITKYLLYIILASALIYIGAKWTIEGSTAVALYFNIPEFIIGLIAIALGTSLPEIAVVFSAYRNNETSLALGNLIGSNIYNVCLILSTTSLIKPLIINLNIQSVIILYLFLLTIFTSFFLKYMFNRFIGCLLIVSYIMFSYYSFI